MQNKTGPLSVIFFQIQGVVIPIGTVVKAATGVKGCFGVGQAVKDNFQTW